MPEYACASIAILNLVNNLPDIDLGKELLDFREFTQNMDPLMRGDTIDSFDFVKRIHNSFARENDMLNADMATQGKVQDAKKQLAQEKARETREAKKAAKTLAETSANATKAAKKGTGRLLRPTGKRTETIESDPSDSDEEDRVYDEKSEAKRGGGDARDALPRRSGRAPKPRKVITDADYEEPESGYHYVAYVPIRDHVWKLDGMDRHPQDLGSFKEGGNGADGGTGDWLDVVTPTIQNRMTANGDDLHFSLMAVVRDPFYDEQRKLLENIKALQAVDSKLDSIEPDWTTFDGGETGKDVIKGISIDFEITQTDIDGAELIASVGDTIANENDVLKLIEYRQGLLKEQRMLRSGVRDAREAPKQEEADARLKKHDYSPFVREWLGALAEDAVLGSLLVSS